MPWRREDRAEDSEERWANKQSPEISLVRRLQEAWRG